MVRTLRAPIDASLLRLVRSVSSQYRFAMGTNVGFEWTDVTWNPTRGCTKISACDHRYAKQVAQRKTHDLHLAHPTLKDTNANQLSPFAPQFLEDRPHLPLQLRQSKRVFVNSMKSEFHAHRSLDTVRTVFTAMEMANWHKFQVLAKRPERAARLVAEMPWPNDDGLGTSIENMEVARRADALREMPASVKSISATPSLCPRHDRCDSPRGTEGRRS